MQPDFYSATEEAIEASERLLERDKNLVDKRCMELLNCRCHRLFPLWYIFSPGANCLRIWPLPPELIVLGYGFSPWSYCPRMETLPLEKSLRLYLDGRVQIKTLYVKRLLSVPSIPSVPNIHNIPSVPIVPSVLSDPSIPSVPTVPSVPSISAVPSVPNVPSVSAVPSVPNVPI